MSKAEQKRQWEQRLRDRFFDMYGRSCSCCGERERVFLTLDHVQGDGFANRYRGPGLARGNNRPAYTEAVKDYRPDRYRVLCQNCNHAWRLGSCPHQQSCANREAPDVAGGLITEPLHPTSRRQQEENNALAEGEAARPEPAQRIEAGTEEGPAGPQATE